MPAPGDPVGAALPAWCAQVARWERPFRSRPTGGGVGWTFSSVQASVMNWTTPPVWRSGRMVRSRVTKEASPSLEPA